MSRYFPGEQVEHAFSAHRLCNWEVPKKEGVERVSAAHPYDTLRSRDGKTGFIANDRGHLLPRGTSVLGGEEHDITKMKETSFNHEPAVYDKTFARWPQPNPAIPAYEAATMGYKGIKTNYLPSSTITLKAVDMPQPTRPDGGVGTKYGKEYNYNFM